VHPYLSVDAANCLVDLRVKIIGMDTITPDIPIPMRPEGFDFPVHRILLGKDILVIETLGRNLRQLLAKRLTIGAFPLRIKRADGAPCPVLGLLEE
jgi:arylformamidase